MKLKNWDSSRLVEGSAVRQKLAEYFEELLNVQDNVQASIGTVGVWPAK